MSKQTLDYQSLSTARQQKSELCRRGALKGAGIAAIVTPPALFLAFLSTGGGHGTYAAALLLFPIPIAAAVLITGSIGVPSLILALVQFPLYGAIIGYCTGISRKAVAAAIWGIILAHALAFAIATSWRGLS